MLLALLPTITVAQDNCVLQDRTVTRVDARIAERGSIRRDVVPYFSNQKRCIVDFRVRIGAQWHAANGEYTWSGNLPDDQACAVAVQRAEQSVLDRVAQHHSVSERILVCRDDQNSKSLTKTDIGTVGEVTQFRPHPEYTQRFYHNGTQCKWFVETGFTGRNVRTYQGIICQIRPQKWVVVDKF